MYLKESANLKSLYNEITKNKKFITFVQGDFDGITIPVTDYGYDPQDNVFYLFCDEDGEPVNAKELLAASYKYPTTNLVIVNETLRAIKDVKSFYTLYGDSSFGEGNSLVCK